MQGCCFIGKIILLPPKNAHIMKTDFRVIIAGSHTFTDYPLLVQKCDNILSGIRRNSNIVIISGTARGADRLGEKYASERGFPIRRFPANWSRDGRAAGPIRNALMADNADALIAFWDGQSRGTKNMIDNAREKGLAVRIINYNNTTRMKEDPKIEVLRRQTADYAVQHITGKGMHTGIRWLQDSFNDYYAAISTPGVKISEESEIGHRHILAQKVAIDCIRQLSSEQLERLDKVLDRIAKDVGVIQYLRR